MLHANQFESNLILYLKLFDHVSYNLLAWYVTKLHLSHVIKAASRPRDQRGASLAPDTSLQPRHAPFTQAVRISYTYVIVLSRAPRVS